MAALDVVLSLIIHLSKVASSSGRTNIHLPHFRHFVCGLIVCPPSPRPSSDADFGQGRGVIEIDVRDRFLEKNLTIHDDLRWFFLRESAYVSLDLSCSEKPTYHLILSASVES